ncbi:hypothetical protein Y1Q_0006094 [Alligator mississippiensis]|uniref:Uncharacterized protein n=1 Tax=Alligator mississippiensis TaxID=8496 RepID=A0A151N3X1_ALLMI|nr:hypothetical protein Y1Q_0006094 [Alligator mississippiensis]
MRSASRRETALLQLAPSANPSGCGKSTNLLGCIALGQVGNSVSELGDRRMFSSLQGCAGSWRFPGSAIASFRHNTPHLSHGQRKMLCEASQDWAMGGHAFLFHFEAESTGEPRSMASLKDAWADKQSGRPASLRCPPDDPNLIWRSQPF